MRFHENLLREAAGLPNSQQRQLQSPCFRVSVLVCYMCMLTYFGTSVPSEVDVPLCIVARQRATVGVKDALSRMLPAFTHAA